MELSHKQDLESLVPQIVREVLRAINNQQAPSTKEVGIAEAAAICGYSTSRFRQLTKQGHVPHTKQGIRYKYSTAALQKWKAEGCPQRGEFRASIRRELLK